MLKAVLLVVVVSLLGASDASAVTLKECNKGSGMDISRCRLANIKLLNTAIDQKVAGICSKEVAAGGSMGPAARDERLICHQERLSRILDAVR